MVVDHIAIWFVDVSLWRQYAGLDSARQYFSDICDPWCNQPIYG